MKYRNVQSQISDNLNMIDQIAEKKLIDLEDKFNVGNGLKQIEQDVSDLCSYIDSLHKTLKDQEDNLARTLIEFEKLKPEEPINPNEDSDPSISENPPNSNPPGELSK